MRKVIGKSYDEFEDEAEMIHNEAMGEIPEKADEILGHSPCDCESNNDSCDSCDSGNEKWSS